MEAERRAVIFGAGAVGGYLGARLSVAVPPWDVDLIARGPMVEAVNRAGLRVSGQDAAIDAHPRAFTSAMDVRPARLVLLTVRGDDVATSIEPLRMLLASDGILVAVQNGIGTDDVLVRAFGPERVVAAALTTSVTVTEPGQIERTSRANGIGLAGFGGRSVPAWLIETWASAGVPVTVISDPRSLRWSKLLLNMLGAPLSAILDMDIGDLVADPRLFRIEQLTFREATRVIDALGIATVDLPGYPVRLARAAMRLPRPLAQRLLAPRIARARGGRSPGMRTDIQRGRSEIDTFHGAIASAGIRAGVPTPLCAALAELVRELTANLDRRPTFAGNPGALLGWLQERGIAIR